MHQRNAHCSYCGQRFVEGAPWPRTCAGCGRTTWLNPLPVGVLLLPVDDGVLCVRRGIEPGLGMLAMPGGFLDVHETWQQGMARELFEETGVRVDPAEVRLLDALSVVPEGMLVLFGEARRRTAAELPPFVANDEVTDCVILSQPQELAFSTHTHVLRAWFDRRAKT
jgi:ADP-ribose pyrophosphatase YjhB (NUDIX family)